MHFQDSIVVHRYFFADRMRPLVWHETRLSICIYTRSPFSKLKKRNSRAKPSNNITTGMLPPRVLHPPISFSQAWLNMPEHLCRHYLLLPPRMQRDAQEGAHTIFMLSQRYKSAELHFRCPPSNVRRTGQLFLDECELQMVPVRTSWVLSFTPIRTCASTAKRFSTNFQLLSRSLPSRNIMALHS